MDGEELLEAGAPRGLHVEDDVLGGEGGTHQTPGEAGRHNRLTTLTRPAILHISWVGKLVLFHGNPTGQSVVCL